MQLTIYHHVLGLTSLNDVSVIYHFFVSPKEGVEYKTVFYEMP